MCPNTLTGTQFNLTLPSCAKICEKVSFNSASVQAIKCRLKRIAKRIFFDHADINFHQPVRGKACTGAYEPLSVFLTWGYYGHKKHMALCEALKSWKGDRDHFILEFKRSDRFFAESAPRWKQCLTKDIQMPAKSKFQQCVPLGRAPDHCSPLSC